MLFMNKRFGHCSYEAIAIYMNHFIVTYLSVLFMQPMGKKEVRAKKAAFHTTSQFDKYH